MIYIYGDSHAYYSFQGLPLEYTDLHCNSITMFRIGRDGIIPRFVHPHLNDTLVFVYGEIDCRCHIQKQSHENSAIDTLVENYMYTIHRHATNRVILVAVLPPTRREEYERFHHDFPFIGTDEDRVRITKKVNARLELVSKRYGYTYFNPYAFCTRPDGTLCHEMSDTRVHLMNTTPVIQQFLDCIDFRK